MGLPPCRRHERVLVVLPTSILPEVTAGARRGSGSADVARRVASAITDGTALILVGLDEHLASAAAEIAAECGIKGSDAVYGATARRYGSMLITLDRQQRERMPADVVTATPAAALGDREDAE